MTVAPLIGAGLLALAVLGPVQADTASLSELVEEARQANPRLLAARLGAEAAIERVAPAGALPDPMLSFGVMNRSVSDPGRSDIQMTMNQLQLSQRLPWWGTRARASERMRALADAEAREVEELEATIVSRVTQAYYELAYLDGAASTMASTRELLRDFREISETLYGVGTALQSDVLQAQVSVAEITADLRALGERRVSTVARLNALLGRSPESPIGAASMPLALSGLPELQSLLNRAAEARPAVKAARDRVRAAEAARAEADLNNRPDVSITLGYAQRPDFPDLASLMVGVNLPVFSGSRLEPQRREREAQARMREAEELELLNETYARLAELRAAAERARELDSMYETSILPQASAAVESALSAYRVGRVEYQTLLSTEMTVNRFEIERIRLRADYHQAVAGIDALLGGGLRSEEDR